ncbi:MAG: hypothetical protein JW774_13925, partial [Candidatus Aureabacteria bacterium]|nr:hypothetical protein [Candidatus Auribacterota bacterium]
HGQIADVCWKLEIIAPVRIEKVQLCFHLDESFYQVLDSKGNELKINRSRAGNNRHEVHEATLSNDHYVFKRPEGQLTLDGRKLLFPFVQSVESSSQRALISNFTWLPDPVLFEPGIHELGSIRIFFIPFS